MFYDTFVSYRLSTMRDHQARLDNRLIKTPCYIIFQLLNEINKTVIFETYCCSSDMLCIMCHTVKHS